MLTVPRRNPQRACNALPMLLLPLLLLLYDWRSVSASLGFSDDALSQAGHEQGWSLPDEAQQELSPRSRQELPPPQHQDSFSFEPQDAHSMLAPRDCRQLSYCHLAFGQGRCVDGRCLCREGFSGETCAEDDPADPEPSRSSGPDGSSDDVHRSFHIRGVRSDAACAAACDAEPACVGYAFDATYEVCEAYASERLGHRSGRVGWGEATPPARRPAAAVGWGEAAAPTDLRPVAAVGWGETTPPTDRRPAAAAGWGEDAAAPTDRRPAAAIGWGEEAAPLPTSSWQAQPTNLGGW
ncbi:hypothetical protein EMIHUDRAFT_216811, partial [Emiliania huxleyi CCMP1516]|uniref:EGF-like domain-containing protein n=2 Tax=Emiliania huxleyi TaxID=2903 RepID=A0A0D3ICM1_EMIH1